ncbi:hypothetical protein K493DRAFT_334396 [Basidiobolus meristosporus CBS 931.73]|uniref:Uncharacterized protein n=1 Tax=Basidiobolus meristosporus CBS 931.73 TaxID=1314790 RepID=A0A1Y1YYM9_9FUNG|nr:hypothetical protein K493DRAFT_334396 [Basidiobolus meristosporus CBS 931.73]|eukprot:ORY02974.1 hypothetical protein K493DRAFT_334396 [Basidiobolus meristosporus CBS 931.73]
MSGYPPNQGYPSQGYPPPPQGGPQDNDRAFFPGGFHFGGHSSQHPPAPGQTGPYSPPPTQGGSQYPPNGPPSGQPHFPPNGAPPGQSGPACPPNGAPPSQSGPACPPNGAPPGQSGPTRPPNGAPPGQTGPSHPPNGAPPAQPCPPGGAPNGQGSSATCTNTKSSPQGPPPGAAICPPNPNAKPNRPMLDWVYASGGSIPPNAVQGGVESDGKPLFIARQFYQGGLHVGKVGPHLKSISLGYDGKEINLKDYYVLCGDARQLRWVECHGICNPDNWRPVEAGHESDGKPLFHCQNSLRWG